MARPSVITQSGHEDEIKHLLIELRWGSRTTEKYLELKYGLKIGHSTLRAWRAKTVERLQLKGELQEWEPPKGNGPDKQIDRIMHPNDDIPDILQKRLALIKLQEERIRLDVKHELTMGKTFNTSVREMEFLNKLLNDAKGDMQDIGLWPTREGQPTVVNNIHAQAVAASAAHVSGNDNGIKVDPEILAKIGRKVLVAKNDLAVERAEKILAEQGIEA